MNRIPRTIGTHLHYALYSSVVLALLLLHGDQPIESTASKLTIFIMCGLMLGEAVTRMIQAARER